MNIRKLLFLVFSSISLIVSVAGCHTIHGAGEDIERTGQKIQEHS
ncbi:MAG: entericidin [Verrucomicrobia bacterium]|nr:MAG: entericidin [Verrucomicrobiota bacterium]